MLLIDALYINNSGGKILLDYLISELEKTQEPIHYLLDLRIQNNHPTIKSSNKVTYSKASLLKRHFFYRKNEKTFNKVFCFGNLPPTLKLEVPVYTYFHQKLFLQIPDELSFSQKMVLGLKSKIFQKLLSNTEFWMVQTIAVKNEFLKKFPNIHKDTVILMPFYPSYTNAPSIVYREKNSFVYVSNGSPHKNHQRLIEAFAKFYQKHQAGKLYVTIGDEFIALQTLITKYQAKGVPIVNVGFLNRLELEIVYKKSEYLVFPSLTESFGLGLLEAIENGCKIIGADLPYTYAVCNPSLIFDPYDVESIAKTLYLASTKKTNLPEQLVFNEVNKLIKLLKKTC